MQPHIIQSSCHNLYFSTIDHSTMVGLCMDTSLSVHYSSPESGTGPFLWRGSHSRRQSWRQRRLVGSLVGSGLWSGRYLLQYPVGHTPADTCTINIIPQIDTVVCALYCKHGQEILRNEGKSTQWKNVLYAATYIHSLRKTLSHTIESSSDSTVNIIMPKYCIIIYLHIQ